MKTNEVEMGIKNLPIIKVQRCHIKVIPASILCPKCQQYYIAYNDKTQRYDCFNKNCDISLERKDFQELAAEGYLKSKAEQG